MDAPKEFRSAFNGFNREDVVGYIEFLNNKHTSQLNQLRTELTNANAALSALRSAQAEDQSGALAESREKCAAMASELRACHEKIAQLEAALREADHSGEELEAYRRAERAERAAQSRAAQLCKQANAALADATAKVGGAAGTLEDAADQVSEQLRALQSVVLGSKAALKDAAASLYAIPCAQVEE